MGLFTPPPIVFPRGELRKKLRQNEGGQLRNLITGVYLDADGEIPRLAALTDMADVVRTEPSSPDYTDTLGDPTFREALPAQMELQRTLVAQTIGGTGALHLILRLAKHLSPTSRLHLPHPTWSNHHHIARSIGMPTTSVPWQADATGRLDLKAVLRAVELAGPEDLFLLHAACHNPSGLDPNPEAWRQILQAIAARGAIPLLDLAFWGYKAHPSEELAAIRQQLAPDQRAIWTVSLGKTFSWYNARLGALILQGPDTWRTDMTPHLQWAIRTTWSSPPTYQARVVSRLWGNDAARTAWLNHLAAIRSRLAQLRQTTATALAPHLNPDTVHQMRERVGLFASLHLTPTEVHELETTHGLIVGPGGLFNLSTTWGDGLDRLQRALAERER
ncbi:MAG: aminotransferase class I/II-fold pyridoxal phosphate-dependent enzyme [Myxococcota bacterium]